MRPIPALVAAMAALAAAGPLAAQDVGEPMTGRDIARTWCANCHLIGPGEPVPGPVGDAAPPLAAVAAMPSTTVMSLRVFLQTPHANMPDYRLSRQEMDDVIAWILSLRGR